MASSDANDTPLPSKTCECTESDKNISNTEGTESLEKQPNNCPDCQIIKSGPLLISSKGIGWTSWKKRWFVLTRTSLVFYRADPSAPQKGTEANPTLGGIDLNNSGSVVIKEDKKLLTVFFPDGRDGRTFTLKGETIDELQEWKTALESALAQAPNAGVAMGQNAIFRSDVANPVEESSEQSSDKQQPVKAVVIGRPVLLALQEVDGSPSFLEKALRFIEDYGLKVEGVLRQSADVEEVLRRVQDYESGRVEFSPDEDAHVIGDCIKYVLREMPSSPVPASCCTALVEAYRSDRGNRIHAIRQAISETFPEPNLRLLQRVLDMMHIVESEKAINRMSLSALAACMAPLLLRPLLAGECEFEDNFNMGGGDGSLQLLKAAAAANHAQAIVIILLEEYDNIFDDDLMDDGSFSSEGYTESEEDDIDDDGSTDNDMEDDGDHDSENDLEAGTEDDLEHSSSRSGTLSGSSSYRDSYQSDKQEQVYTRSSSPGYTEDNESVESPSSTLNDTTSVQNIGQKNGVLRNENNCSTASPSKHARDVKSSAGPKQKSISHPSPASIAKFCKKSNESIGTSRRQPIRGSSSARKSLSEETIYYSTDDDIAVQRLETTKRNLQTKITKEVKGNAVLQSSLKKKKEALHQRRLALEKDVERLREQLQKERHLKVSLESGLMNIRPGHVSITPTMDAKTRADLEEMNIVETEIVQLKQKVADLRGQLSQHIQTNNGVVCVSCNRHLHEQEKDQQIENSATNDNLNLGADLDTQSLKAQSQNSPTLADSQPSNKLPRKTTKKGKSKSKDAPSNEEPTSLMRNFASKKSFFKGEKEPQDTTTIGISSASKKSYKSEDEVSAATSASALSRLTNRLHFLKERRVQLVKELQTIETPQNARPEQPARTSSR